jgi:hypothetical protein
MDDIRRVIAKLRSGDFRRIDPRMLIGSSLKEQA